MNIIIDPIIALLSAHFNLRVCLDLKMDLKKWIWEKN